jgi:hypothetical protein
MNLDAPVAGALPKPAGVFKRLLCEAAVWLPLAAVLWFLPQADLVDQSFFVAYTVLMVGIRVRRGIKFHNWPWLVLHGAICCTLLSELDKLQGYHSDLGNDFPLFFAQGLLWIATFVVLVTRIRQPRHWWVGVAAGLVLVDTVLTGPMQFTRQLWYQSMDHRQACVYATKITSDMVYGVAFENRSKIVWFSREEGAEAKASFIDVTGLGFGLGSMDAQVANLNLPVFKLSQRLFCKT